MNAFQLRALPEDSRVRGKTKTIRTVPEGTVRALILLAFRAALYDALSTHETAERLTSRDDKEQTTHGPDADRNGALHVQNGVRCYLSLEHREPDVWTAAGHGGFYMAAGLQLERLWRLGMLFTANRSVEYVDDPS